jgi:zinc transporter
MFERPPIELPDHRGLICGFLLRPQDQVKPLEWDEVTEIFGTSGNALWLHFNLIDARSRNWITNCDLIRQLAKDLLLASNSPCNLKPSILKKSKDRSPFALQKFKLRSMIKKYYLEM